MDDASRIAELERRLAAAETALRETEDRQAVLVAELQHRVRNILAVIRSVFTRTVNAGRNLEEVIQHFQGRLDALARTQTMVIKRTDRGADLEEMIRDELLSVGAADGPRLRIEGPDVDLSPRAAEMMALALHELTTNAIKYGALRTPTGELDIRWSINMDYRDTPRLDFTWMEQGVPTVEIHPEHQGFGRELIEKALPYRLGAETKLDFRGGGISCRITLPLV